jgi:hypothetical protein
VKPQHVVMLRWLNADLHAPDSSWWTEEDRETFPQRVEQETPRMRLSRLALVISPISRSAE